MNSNDDFLKNMKVNVNPDDLVSTQLAAPIPEETSEAESSANLLSSFFASKLEKQSDKISNLENKILLLKDKIKRNTNKIDRLNSKINKLEMQNKFLSTIAKINPRSAGIAQAMINKNFKKADTIKNVKIPRRFDKIHNHELSIIKTEKSIEKCKLKIATLGNIQYYFDSFTMSNAEQRQENFISCVSSMNDSAVFKAQNKVQIYSEKLINLQEQTQFLKSNNAQAESKAWIGKMLEKNESKIMSLQKKVYIWNGRLEKYTQLESGITDINSKELNERLSRIETVMQESKKELPSFTESTINMSSALMVDKILTHSASAVRNTLEKPLEKTSESIKIKATSKKSDKTQESQKQKKPSLINKLKENEKVVKQASAEIKQKVNSNSNDRAMD